MVSFRPFWTAGLALMGWVFGAGLAAETPGRAKPPDAPERCLMGVNAHYAQPHLRDRYLRAWPHLLELKAESVRDELPWHRMVTASGKLEMPADLLKLYLDLARNEIRPLIVLGYGNPKLLPRQSDGSPIYPDHSPHVLRSLDARFLHKQHHLIKPAQGKAMAAFAGYCRFVADRLNQAFKTEKIPQKYHPIYQIWNEWDCDMDLKGRLPDLYADEQVAGASARAYVDLVCQSAREIGQADPDALILAGCFTAKAMDQHWHSKWFFPAMDERIKEHKDAFAGSARRLFDGISLNPHVLAHATDKAIGEATPERVEGYVKEVIAQLDATATLQGMPVYVTEIGWPTLPAKEAKAGAEGQPADWIRRMLGWFDHPLRATHLERTFLLLRQNARVKGVWWYDLVNDCDRPGSACADPFHYTGLLDGTGTERSLAYRTFQELLKGRRGPETKAEAPASGS